MDRTVHQIDIPGLLERTFTCKIDEGSNDLTAVRVIGDGRTTRHNDQYRINLNSSVMPEFWRDNIRYELRKYSTAAKTLMFDDSVTCKSERHDELEGKLRRFLDSETLPEPLGFLAIEFELAENHGVSIFLICEASVVANDCKSVSPN